MTVTTTTVSRQQRRVLPLTPPSAVERASGVARLPPVYISNDSLEVLCVTAVLSNSAVAVCEAWSCSSFSFDIDDN